MFQGCGRVVTPCLAVDRPLDAMGGASSRSEHVRVVDGLVQRLTPCRDRRVARRIEGLRLDRLSFDLQRGEPGRAPTEAVEDVVGRTRRVFGDDEIQVNPVAWGEVEPIERERLCCVHSIHADDPCIECTKVGSIDAPVRCVHEAKSNPRPWANAPAHRCVSVDRHLPTPSTIVREVMTGHEPRVDATIWPQSPVVEHPHLIVVIRQGLDIVHDEHAIQPALDLLGATDVWMEPEGPGVLGDESVRELAAWRDWVLRDTGHTIHGVGDSDTMPVNGRGLWEVVLQAYHDLFSQAHPKDRSRDLTVVRPDIEQAPVKELHRGRRCPQIERSRPLRRGRFDGVRTLEFTRKTLSDRRYRGRTGLHRLGLLLGVGRFGCRRATITTNAPHHTCKRKACHHRSHRVRHHNLTSSRAQ